ncbi:uncharacterized protein ARB_07648 [Trichophyton benhamiae CBS 112371]|uniref:Transmembrane protein n=1 Tax=Arthroderma benhamiae (strain ATCC MYA-4681 / CBS 112371) TaxID=663331 RepID=D4ATT2_ARTBC|nr:uncharacterized protein ARB_07648 [Trichophyton benhamiae CBS 112371]EFE33701.1 hypothetical protein ARB_07648 [Trichophyton benhamiae CBS 112371]
MRRNADEEIKEEEEEKVQKKGKMGVYIDLREGLLHYLQTPLAVLVTLPASLSSSLSLSSRSLLLRIPFFTVSLHGVSSRCLFTVSLHGYLFTISVFTLSCWVSLSSQCVFTILFFTLLSYLLYSLCYLHVFTVTLPIPALSVSIFTLYLLFYPFTVS